MYSRQDDKLVQKEAKLLYENNELKLPKMAKKKYFDAYNSNKPLDTSGESKVKRKRCYLNIKMINSMQQIQIDLL